MSNIDAAIQWYVDKQKQGITYSMTDRMGPNSYDCSSAGYFALIVGGFFPSTTIIGNTDSIFNDLERNGWEQIQPDAQGNYPTQRGDVVIWGHRGASAGSFGHFMMFVDADNVIHCNSYYNGIHVDNYDYLASANGWPEATFYRYTGVTYSPPSISGSPTDQLLDVGSFIRFDKTYTVDDVQSIDNMWQVRTNELCKNNFTWDDNGIPADPLVEVDNDGYATPDQQLNIGSLYKIPGKFEVLDIGFIDQMWLAMIQWNGFKFWVDVETATEVPSDDSGTPTPEPQPQPIEPTVPPDSPVVVPVSTPQASTIPIESTPVQSTVPANNQQEENNMAFTQEQQQQLDVATQTVQATANDIANTPEVTQLINEVPQRVKLIVYIVADSLIGLGLLVPGLAVVFNAGTVTQVAALSGVLATAGAFILTMFGIYKSGKK